METIFKLIGGVLALAGLFDLCRRIKAFLRESVFISLRSPEKVLNWQCVQIANASFVAAKKLHRLSKQLPPGPDRDKAITLTDAVQIAAYLFRPGATALTCLDAADTNDDGILDVSDPVYLLFYLFRQGPAPPAPFDQEGSDPTFRDNLGCEE